MAQSWRLDGSEREVQPTKQTQTRPTPNSTMVPTRPAAPPPATKKPSWQDDDDEHDFTAPKKVTGRTTSPAPAPAPVRSISVTEYARAEELWDPHKYALVRTVLQRGPSQPLGFDVSSGASGVFKVVNVARDQVAAKVGIENDMYVLSVDGKRIKSSSQFNDLERSNKHAFSVCLVKKRPHPFQQQFFPMPANLHRQPRHDYFLYRLDPTDGTKVGTGIAERHGALTVTQLVDNGAGQKAGVQVGDRVLAIDDTRVENQAKCKDLVLQSGGNPFDMILERAHPSPPPTPAPPPPPPTPAPAPKPALPPPPPVDPNAGDPSAGVPRTPDDVSMIVDDKTKQTLSKIRPPKKKKPKSPKVKSPESTEKTAESEDKKNKEKEKEKEKEKGTRSVRVIKKVESTKLHQKKK